MEVKGWAGGLRARAGPDWRAGAGCSPMAASFFFNMETRMLISLSRCCTWKKDDMGIEPLARCFA